MLNDAKLRAAVPRDKAYKLTDSQRLYLLVTPRGSKLWRLNYTYDSKQKTLAIGPHSIESDRSRPLLSVAIHPRSGRDNISPHG